MIKLILLFMMAFSLNFNVVHYHYHMNDSSSLQPKHFSGNKHDWDWYQKKKCWWKCGFEHCHSYGVAFDCKGDDENRKFEACDKACKQHVEQTGEATSVKVSTGTTTSAKTGVVSNTKATGSLAHH